MIHPDDELIKRMRNNRYLFRATIAAILLLAVRAFYYLAGVSQ